MSYHIIDISTNNVSLTAKDGQLVCKSPDDTVRKLPMEDIGAVLINSFSVQLHNSFLIEAAKRRVAVIVCECFRPVSLVLPVQRVTDTILTRSQIQAPARLLRRMWEITVSAKCANQYELVSRLCNEEDRRLSDFRITMNGMSAAKEGNCARLYWGMFSRALSLKDFRRLPCEDGLNSLLNYGYAVLLLRIEQKLLAFGLDPLYGMGHVLRERSLPLAYDMMEPFRPIVDELVYDWVKTHDASTDALEVTQEYKLMMHTMMERRFPYKIVRSLSLDRIMDAVIKSYRQALRSGKHKEYEPWIRRNSKWDG